MMVLSQIESMASTDKKTAKKDISFSSDGLPLELRRHGKDFLFSIRWAHRARVGSDWGFQDRINDDGHLLWVIGGKGKYLVEGVEVDLMRGTWVFVGPGVLHEAYADKDDPPEIIPVRFNIIPNRSSKNDHFLVGKCFFGRSNSPSILESLFEELHKQSKAMQGDFRRSICDSLIHSIISLAYLEERKGKSPSLSGRLESARERLSEEFPGPSVSELASECHLSERHFNRTFTEAYGLTPRDFRLSAMMDRARAHLVEGDLSISDIALSLGYQDSFSFSRQFKQRAGVSPLRWRKENG